MSGAPHLAPGTKCPGAHAGYGTPLAAAPRFQLQPARRPGLTRHLPFSATLADDEGNAHVDAP